MQEQDRFRIWIPLQKGGEETVKGQKVPIVQGIASTEDPDLQNEIVVQEGMDLTPLLEEGYINWNHMPGPENIIGEPLEARIQKGPSLWIKGFLYPHVERAKAVVKLLESQEIPVSNRRLGWSVEGRVVEREGNRVVKSIVQHLAITHEPVNPYTWAELVKSMTTGTAAPLRLQNLDVGLANLLFSPCKKGCYDGKRFREGVKGAYEHLTKCHGVKEKDAYDFLLKLYRIFHP
ncbi:MAG: hypothetical protein ACPL5F_01400 [Moorellaceae bacterium]